jgi:hypothetical protein
MKHLLPALWRVHLHRPLINRAVPTGARRQRFQLVAAVALLLTLPLLALGQNDTTVRQGLNRILRPTENIMTDGLVEIQFLNLGQKAITGFRYSRIDRHANGKQVVHEKAGGADFVSATSEQYVAPGSPQEGGRLQPNQAFTARFNAPASSDGSALVGVDVTVTALTFADRTALGDPKVVKSILSSRRQESARADAGLAEARSLLAEPDPGKAVAARLAKIRESGNRSGSQSFLETLSYGLAKADPALVQKILAIWETRRQALVMHSTLKGGNNNGSD